MSHIEDLDELLEPYGFDLQEWAADGTASWEHVEYRHPAFPQTTRIFIAHNGTELTFCIEHLDVRGPFYTKPLARLDYTELDNLLQTLISTGEDD